MLVDSAATIFQLSLRNPIHFLVWLLTIMQLQELAKSANNRPLPSFLDLQQPTAVNGYGFMLTGILSSISESSNASCFVVKGVNINNDNYSDFIINGPYTQADLTDNVFNRGTSILVRGNAGLSNRSLLNFSNLAGLSTSIVYGGQDDFSQIAGTLDFDRDGFQDLVFARTANVGNGQGYFPARISIVWGGPNVSNTLRLNKLSISDGITFESQGLYSKWFSYSVAQGKGKKDINDDGYDDLVFGDAADKRSNALTNPPAGFIYVIFGKPRAQFNMLNDINTLVTNPDRGWVIRGAENGDDAGKTITIANIDGTGPADILVSAQYATANGRNKAGKVYLIRGHSPFNKVSTLSDNMGANGMVFMGSAPGSNLWLSYQGADVGDIDGDGREDFMLNEIGALGGVGRGYLFYESPSFTQNIDVADLSQLAVTTFHGDVSTGGSYFHQTTRLGDMNRDGKGEIGFNAFSASLSVGDVVRNDAGIVIFYYGTAARPRNVMLADVPSLHPGMRIVGTVRGSVGGPCGSITYTGDINGDGYDEGFFDLRGALPAGSPIWAHTSYMIFGDGVAPTAPVFDFTCLANNAAFNPAPRILAEDDVIKITSEKRGLTHFADISTKFKQTFDIDLPTSSSSHIDFAAIVAGQFNSADNTSDMAFAHAQANFGGRTLSGAIYFVNGGPKFAPQATTQLPKLSPNSGYDAVYYGVSNSQAGKRIAPVGRFNNDAYDDVLVTTQPINPDVVHPAAFLLFGGTTATSVALDQITKSQGVRFLLPLACGSANFTTIPAGVGDVDGDGFHDIAFGFPMMSVKDKSNAGVTVLIHGEANPSLEVDMRDLNNIKGARSTVIKGQQANDAFGTSIAGGYNIDGAGEVDVVIGAPGVVQGQSNNTGKAFVFTKFSSTASSTMDLANVSSIVHQLTGEANTQFGAHVSVLPPFPGSKFARVAISASLATINEHVGAGKLYVINGDSIGFVAFDATLLDETQGRIIQGSFTADALASRVVDIGDVDNDQKTELFLASVRANNYGNSPVATSYALMGRHLQVANRLVQTRALSETQGRQVAHQADTGYFNQHFSISPLADVDGDNKPDEILLATVDATQGSSQQFGFRTRVTVLKRGFFQPQLPASTTTTNSPQQTSASTTGGSVPDSTTSTSAMQLIPTTMLTTTAAEQTLKPGAQDETKDNANPDLTAALGGGIGAPLVALLGVGIGIYHRAAITRRMNALFARNKPDPHNVIGALAEFQVMENQHNNESKKLKP